MERRRVGFSFFLYNHTSIASDMALESLFGLAKPILMDGGKLEQCMW